MADKERLLKIFHNMMLIRRFEEAVFDFHEKKYFSGHYHLYIGQEATGASVMASLKKKDRIFSTHRNHGHIIARGVKPSSAMAEILHRKDGTNGGRGGTFHLSAADSGMPHTSALVGGAVPLAVGAGFASKMRKSGGVGISMFGDGCLEEGVVFESMNLAVLWQLPVIFVCENNTPGGVLKSQGGNNTSNMPEGRVIQVPKALGIECHEVDGGDVRAVDAIFSECINRVRNTSSPIFIEALTERWPGNYYSYPRLVTGVTQISMAWDEMDIPEENSNWFSLHDPVLRFARQLIDDGTMTFGDIAEVDKDTTQIVKKACKFALSSPEPVIDDINKHVLAAAV